MRIVHCCGRLTGLAVVRDSEITRLTRVDAIVGDFFVMVLDSSLVVSCERLYH